MCECTHRGEFLSCSPSQAGAPSQAGHWLCTVPSYCCRLWKTPFGHLCLHLGIKMGPEKPMAHAFLSTITSGELRFSPRAHLSLWKTLLSQMESCFVSLFLNSVALSVLSTSFPLPNPNLSKTAYFLAWIFRHSLFLQRQNLHLFLFSSHYSGKFPWQGEEMTTLPFSNIFLMFSTPKPNALKYFDSKSIILIRKPRQ